MGRSKKGSLDSFVDQKDLSASTSRLLMWQAARAYSVKALTPLLRDPEIEVRTTAARELQIRGGPAAWAAAKKLCTSNNVCHRVMGLFVLGQLGTPRLPYREKTFALIDSLLRRPQHAAVVEQALYSVGHLRKGKPLTHAGLLQRIDSLRVRRHSKLALAKAFALR